MIRYRHRCLRLLFGILLAIGGSLAVAEEQAASHQGRLSDGGIALEWRIDLSQNAPGGPAAGSLRVAMKDAASGEPIRGRRPLAWLSSKLPTLASEEFTCAQKARGLASPGAGFRADVDLNNYRLVTVNTDRTVAFINPFVGLNNAKLESIVVLPGDPLIWRLDEPHRRMVVITRKPDALLIVDTVQRKIVKQLDLGGSIAAMEVDEDSGDVWVLMKSGGRLLQIDAATLQTRREVKLASDASSIVLPPKAPWVFVSHATQAMVTLLSRQDVRAPQAVALTQPAKIMQWNALAQALAVVSGKGTLQWLDPAAAQASAPTVIAAGTSDLRSVDDGRLLVLLSPSAGSVQWIDAASRAVIADMKIEDPAVRLHDRLAGTREYVYVVDQAQQKLGMLPIHEARAGRVSPVWLGAGQGGDAQDAWRGAAQAIVAAPEGNGVFLAHPRDQVIYRYAEGMMTPVGSLSNYRRSPIGMAVLGGGLQEVAPGEYVAPVRIEAAGRYELVVSQASPKFSACTTLSINGPVAPAAEKTSGAVVTLVSLERSTAASDAALLRFDVKVKISGKETSEPPADARLLVYEHETGWQARVPLIRIDGSQYRASIQLPQRGTYDLMAASASQGLSFAQGRLGRYVLPADEKSIGAPIAAGQNAAQGDVRASQ